MDKLQIKIVAIDHNKDNLTSLKNIILEFMPSAEIYTAQNSVNGIKLVKQIDPDVVLLDISEPKITGFEICETLKRETYFKMIPIVFLTASKPDLETRIHAAEAGAEGFMQKPIDGIDLYGQIYSMKKIKAANLYQYYEKERLEELVNERTENIQKELTRRISAEAEITETVEYYQKLFNNAPIAYQSLDDYGNFIDVNEKWCEIFGTNKQEVIGKNFASFLVPSYQDNFKKRFDLLKKLGSIHSEFLMIDSKGKILDIEFDGKIVYEKNTSKLRTMCALNNVTEIKSIQEEIKLSEEKYRDLVNQMPLGLAVHEIICDATGKPVDYKFLDVNESFEQILGMKAQDIIGKTVKEILPETEDYWIERYGQTALTGESDRFENYASNLNKYFNVSVYRNAKNQFVVVAMDITNSINLNKDLALEKQRLSRVVESTADIIFEIDKSKRFISVYGKGLMKIGHTPETYMGKTVIEVFGKDGAIKEIAYSKALKGESVSYQWTHKNGKETLYFESNISPIYDQAEIIGAVGIARDISTQKKNQNELQYMSNHDYLTGLYNRRYFELELIEMSHEENYPMGIMMLDLNGLKIFNDAYGHFAGDKALINASRVLLDTFSEKNVVARIGGDEFAVIIPNTDVDKLYEFKQEINRKIAEITVVNIQMSLAIGYEIITDEHMDVIEVQKNAENHMYRHKIIEGMSIRNHAIKAILQTLTDKYEEEKIHSIRVSQFCVELGRALNLNQDQLNELELAGMYHDIGKISIPDAILDKPARLTDEEFEIMKTHTDVGYSILKAADEYSDLAEHALYHHERWDGKGYPKGLKDVKIPLFSRIINVCDSFEAMTAERPYKKKMSEEDAAKEIIRCSGSQFDPQLAHLFVEDVLKREWK